MQTATAARNEIGPLLDHLIKQLDAEGRATQKAYFNRIRRSLEHAQHDLELATPLMELSTSIHFGFRFSSDVDVLMQRILEKADQVAAVLEARPQQSH
jgi:hypothetical protein